MKKLNVLIACEESQVLTTKGIPHNLKYPVIDGKKKCGKCGEMKTVDNYSIAHGCYVVRCHLCNKEYYNEYRKRPGSLEKRAEYHKKYMQIKKNRDKVNSWHRIWTKTEVANKKRNDQRRIWTSLQKQKAIEYKGGKCQICGYDKCQSALEFHHINPLEKDGNDTGATKDSWMFERKKPELDKCVLLCANCHREVHSGIIKL